MIKGIQKGFPRTKKNSIHPSTAIFQPSSCALNDPPLLLLLLLLQQQNKKKETKVVNLSHAHPPHTGMRSPIETERLRLAQQSLGNKKRKRDIDISRKKEKDKNTNTNTNTNIKPNPHKSSPPSVPSPSAPCCSQTISSNSALDSTCSRRHRRRAKILPASLLCCQ